MKGNTTKCPICKKVYLKHALSKHIAQMAAKEAQYRMVAMINFAKNKPYHFSPAVVMRNCPHWKYYRQQKEVKSRKSIYDL